MDPWLPLVFGGALGGLGTAFTLRRLHRRRDTVERQLLATLMHDLRTPLTSLQLTLGELSHHEHYSPEERETLSRAIEEAVALRSFLENLRLVEAAALSLQERAQVAPVRLQDEVERLRYRYELMARARNVSLDISAAPVEVQADPRLVELILANLVEIGLRLAQALVQLELKPLPGRFELVCRVPGAALPEPLSVTAFAQQRSRQDRVTTMLSLGAVASRLACDAMDWQLTRTSHDTFTVSGARS